jgi:antitoxin ParD1/3/4
MTLDGPSAKRGGRQSAQTHALAHGLPASFRPSILKRNGNNVMAAVENLSVTLPSEMADHMREAVHRGEYASTGEVVREALNEWRLRRAQRQSATEALGEFWDAGLASGPASDAEVAFGRIRERLEAEIRSRENS